MIAVDSNILVYAHRRDSEFHQAAKQTMASLFSQPQPWAIPWPCLYEFYAIVTHPKIYRPPSSSAAALDQISAWLESRSLVLLSEAHETIEKISEIIERSKVAGAAVHDAKIVAICCTHAVTVLYTHDRDFSRFSISTENPLI